MDVKETLSIIPLGGTGDVTKNMYLYEYRDQILIVDCGFGFADETMIGVDLLLPDVTYLQQTKKKVIGMILTHGHEDHIGALPFILPQISSEQNEFPIFATPFTAALATEKLKEFGVNHTITSVSFENPRVTLGSFSAEFIRVTHSIPDTSHVFIKTPIGNFYHGSDFKFDNTPQDGKTSDIEKIKQLTKEGVLCLLSDCLGAERKGWTPSEKEIPPQFDEEVKNASGKVVITTFSSHIARINEAIDIARRYGRKVCFVGRSLLKTKEVAQKLRYLQLDKTMEISLEQLTQYPDNKLLLLIAGSQGQENSGMARIANGEHREVKLSPSDTVIFSADPIPGSELSMYGIIDTIARRDCRVVYTAINSSLHVSGHGSSEELMKLMELVRPKKMLPIGGNYRHMVAYRTLAEKKGYEKKDVILVDDGEETIFSQDGQTSRGRTLPVKNVYVDEVSGEEMESYVLRDRQKLSEGGIFIVLAEIDAATGELVEKPDLIVRGFVVENFGKLQQKLFQDFQTILGGRKGKVSNWVHLRKLLEDATERRIFKETRREPLVLPIIIEV